ncbi:MAG: orotate phosphoribosyltransferase [Deltaproteobacteria bacterium]|nr:orotate phosphoribosyltransferase [Deltaproteobacteria bacterium]
MSPIDYAKLLVSIGAVELRTDPATWFTWASGERAPIYCDNRVVISYPAVRTQIADGLAAAIRGAHPDAEVIAGTATAGIPHAAWVAERLELPMVYVRGSAKDHGKAKRVEGRALRGERVVLIEDLVSFGGSALAACEALEAEGGKVIGVQAIFSYGFPKAAERFAAAGVPVQSLTGYDALLQTLELDLVTKRALLAWRER